MTNMIGAGSFGSRRRYLREQEAFVADLFAKAEGFTTPITKPVASFKAPSAGVSGPAKPKVAVKPATGGLPSASQRLSALKQNMVGQMGQSSGAPAAVGSTGGVAKAKSLKFGSPVKGVRVDDKIKETPLQRLRRMGKFQNQQQSKVTKALKVKIIPATKELPSFARHRPGSSFEYMRSRGTKPRTMQLPKKRPSPSEVRAAIREKGFTTSAGKRRVTSAKEINDATTDAMQSSYGMAGLGTGGMHYSLNPRSRPISKADRSPLKTSVSEDDARHLVERHGLKGPLPKSLSREQKMAAYEARYVSAGGKKAEKWNHRAHNADKVKNGGLAVATTGGAGWLATRGKIKSRALSPTFRHHAETVAGAGAVVGGAGELYAAHARRKRSSYASAPAGVAASALRRMKDYTP